MKLYRKGITTLRMLLLVSMLLVPLTLNVSAQESEAVFINWLKYDLPPLGHYNAFVSNAIVGTGVEAGVYEPLAEYLFLNGTWVPWLATSWSLDTETQNFTVNLRRNVKWHDLNEFTSKDVQCTFYIGYLLRWSIWNYIDKVYAVDSYTVVFHFTDLSIVYESLVLTQTVQSYSVWGTFSDQTMAAIEAGNTTGIDNLRTALLEYRPPVESVIGTGPFELTAVGPDELLLDKFMVYWRAIYVHFDRMILKRAVSDEISRNLFSTGIINSWWTVLPADVRALWDSTANLICWPMPKMPGYNGARWNMFVFPTDIKEVRQALTWALNRTTYVTLARPGEFAPRNPVSVIPIAQLEAYCDPQFIANLIQYDGPNGYAFGGNYEKAKEILDDAGIIDRDGDGVRETEDGRPIVITMAGVIEYGYSKNVDVWVSEAAKIGIKIIPDMVNFAGYMVQYNNLGMDDPTKDSAIVHMFIGAYPNPWQIANAFIIGDRTALLTNAGWDEGILNPEVVTVPDWVTQPWGPSPGQVNMTQVVIDLGKTIDPTEQKMLVQIIAWYSNEYCPWTLATFGGWWNAYNTEEIEGWPADIPDRDDPYKCDALYTAYPAGYGRGGQIFLITLGYLKPKAPAPTISYITVWITKEVSVFFGADGKSYGPLPVGMSISLPTQDADRLIKEGSASITQPVPAGIIEGLQDISAATSRLETTISTLSTDLGTFVDSVNTQVGSLSGLLYATIILQVIVLIVLALVVSMVRHKPPA